MARRKQDQARPEPPRSYPPPPQGRDNLALATLVGVIAVLVISFSNWRDQDRIEESLTDRLGKIENLVAQVSDKVDRAPAQAAQPARRGPDPNRVYPIKTVGSPAKGPAGAAVTIAEFSDFQ